MRGGLAMIDCLSVDRCGKRFVSAADRERRALLDEIAYTTNPDRGLSQAVAFFSSFRDLTASGFWSTKTGIADLQYQGNVFVSEWTGCPDAALRKLGVSLNVGRLRCPSRVGRVLLDPARRLQRNASATTTPTPSVPEIDAACQTTRPALCPADR